MRVLRLFGLAGALAVVMLSGCSSGKSAGPYGHQLILYPGRGYYAHPSVPQFYETPYGVQPNPYPFGGPYWQAYHGMPQPQPQYPGGVPAPGGPSR